MTAVGKNTRSRKLHHYKVSQGVTIASRLERSWREDIRTRKQACHYTVLMVAEKVTFRSRITVTHSRCPNRIRVAKTHSRCPKRIRVAKTLSRCPKRIRIGFVFALTMRRAMFQKRARTYVRTYILKLQSCACAGDPHVPSCQLHACNILGRCETSTIF